MGEGLRSGVVGAVWMVGGSVQGGAAFKELEECFSQRYLFRFL